MSCTNSINSMAIFLHQAKDAELRSILEKHMAAHIQDYNMKCEWVGGGSQQKLSVPQMPAQQGGTAAAPLAVAPNPNATAFDERAIATSYLLTLKRAGREYAWAAFEMSNPQLRTFLEDAFLMCCRHAYEVAQWLTRMGYYPTEQAPSTYTQKLSQTYQPVREMATVR
ncbi:MAG: spore coat protein [Alicyclobacillaceae bacterium]|nr:spore coat protein [Alicyclobacillaceae bacterium]